MLVETKTELKDTLTGKTVLLTGGGGGIAAEAAKAFAYLGARIILAEKNSERGTRTAAEVTARFGSLSAVFHKTDLSNEKEIRKLVSYIRKHAGCPDFIIHNATITPMGALNEVPISLWDQSYAVNLRAPVLITQAFLPDMKKRGSGCVVFVSSSGASPYMGAYETFKTAQSELSATLAMELEGTGVYTFTIGPGLVKTETAVTAIRTVASRMNMTIEEFFALNENHILDAESAGTGFALAVLKAEELHGQEIGSIQILMDWDMAEPSVQNDAAGTRPENPATLHAVSELLSRITETYLQQYSGWQAMNIFEKQWVLRDFKKNAGIAADQVPSKLEAMTTAVQNGDAGRLRSEKPFLTKLTAYWKRQLEVMLGFEKNKEKREEQTRIIQGWIADLEELTALL